MSVSAKGFKTETATLTAGEGLKKGDFITIVSNYEAIPCEDGDTPLGICVGTDGKYATVLFSGYAKITFESAVFPLGACIIAATGDKASPASIGHSCVVLSVDRDEKTAEILF